MKLLRLMVSTLMILVGAKVLAASQTCQDTDLKRQVMYYASNLTRGYYAKWNEVSCASSPGSEALVFSIRHVVSEQHDDHGRLFMTIARVERIVVDGNGKRQREHELLEGKRPGNKHSLAETRRFSFHTPHRVRLSQRVEFQCLCRIPQII